MGKLINVKQLTDNITVYKKAEFEVDIELADKQTIIFGDDKDTAYIAHGYAYDLTDFVYYHIHSDDYSVSDRFWFSMDFVYDK